MLNHRRPNVIFVFSDQHRYQATGFTGNPVVQTPNFDHFADESVVFSTAVSTVPVCSPHRASLITGQYPLTHGVFVNDVPLNGNAVSIAQAFASAGYHTAYIGKWHLDGHGWTTFIPKERRQGFDYWNVLECTHDYHNSLYYDDEAGLKKWEGYDAEAQTRRAQAYIKQQDQTKPFALFLSWGPPHDPYDTAPEAYKKLYQPSQVVLRENVAEQEAKQAREELAGYYAHISALDYYFGELEQTVKDEGIEEDTILIYTSDHGIMLGSQGGFTKERPWDESILVPFLLRYPRVFGKQHKKVSIPIGTPDIMPTLLDLCGISIPETVEGISYLPALRGDESFQIDGVLIECIQPFGSWGKIYGGREFRGLRTEQYTYVRDLNGSWLLYDNIADLYQLHNVVEHPQFQKILEQLDTILQRKLHERNDDFLPGEEYIRQWNYQIDETGRVPIIY